MGFSWSFMIAMGWYDIYVTTQAVNALCGIDQIHNRVSEETTSNKCYTAYYCNLEEHFCHKQYFFKHFFS